LFRGSVHCKHLILFRLQVADPQVAELCGEQFFQQRAIFHGFAGLLSVFLWTLHSRAFLSLFGDPWIAGSGVASTGVSVLFCPSLLRAIRETAEYCVFRGKPNSVPG